MLDWLMLDYLPDKFLIQSGDHAEAKVTALINMLECVHILLHTYSCNVEFTLIYYIQTIVLLFINLLVITVTLLGGPAPTLVCALRRSKYIVSGDNPSTVPISSGILNMLLPKLLIAVASNWMEYCVITPLEVSGGLHFKVTKVELTETNSNN